MKSPLLSFPGSEWDEYEMSQLLSFPRLVCIACPDDEMLELAEDKIGYKSLFEYCVGYYVE